MQLISFEEYRGMSESCLRARLDLYANGSVRQHSNEVGELAGQFLPIIGICPDLAREIAGWHDIGKIGVDEAILLKDGPLDDKEFAEIKRHPVIGLEIINRAGFKVSEITKDVIIGHHLRFLSSIRNSFRISSYPAFSFDPVRDIYHCHGRIFSVENDLPRAVMAILDSLQAGTDYILRPNHKGTNTLANVSSTIYAGINRGMYSPFQKVNTIIKRLFPSIVQYRSKMLDRIEIDNLLEKEFGA